MSATTTDASATEHDQTVSPPPEQARRPPSLARRLAMRPRRVIVRLHRWLSLVLFAWLLVVSLTGAWLVVHHSVESWIHSSRYATTPGDIGLQAAADAALAQAPPESTIDYVTTPRNQRGVYAVWLATPTEAPAGAAEGEEPEPTYRQYFVDPGSGHVNGVVDDEEGASWWLYRGHMYLWQDHGIFGVFDPETGWCRANADGVEPGGVKGVVCDVIPDGQDMVGWFAIGFIVVLLSGFYLWYWPGVRRWATALVIRRHRGAFAFNLSVHKVVGLVVWLPLTAIAFTGAAFAFPNMAKWYDNTTPAKRDFVLWTAPEDLASSAADGREPIDLDRAVQIINERYPERGVDGVTPPADETGTYTAWVTRGYSPWTREGSGGNVYMALDQYSGETLYDGTPEEGNVFDQAWDDWSFPFHSGDIGATATRLLWVAIGLSPLVLGITGITMNLIRRRKRARRRRAPDDSPTAVDPATANARDHDHDGDHDRSAVTSERALSELRGGAALVAMLPQLRVRIRCGDYVLASVVPTPAADSLVEMSTDVFRAEVARAYDDHRVGRPVRLFSLPDDLDPSLEILLPAGDRLHPGGIVRATLGRAWVHLLPVARPLDTCLAELGDLGLHGLSFRPDAAVGVTLLMLPSPVDDEPRAAAALESMHGAAARLAVADLEAHLRAVGDR